MTRTHAPGGGGSGPLVAALRAHPFLAGASDAHLEAIAAHTRELTFGAGDLLLQEGAAADASYLIQAGRVGLELHVPGRGAVRVSTVGEGEVIGWSWINAPYRWHLDARAVEPGRALVLDGATLLARCEADPKLGFEVARRLLRVVQKRLEALRLQVLDVYAPRG